MKRGKKKGERREPEKKDDREYRCGDLGGNRGILAEAPPLLEAPQCPIPRSFLLRSCTLRESPSFSPFLSTQTQLGIGNFRAM